MMAVAGCSSVGVLPKSVVSPRFEVVHATTYWEVTYLLDSASGQVWMLHEVGNNPVWSELVFSGESPPVKSIGTYRLNISNSKLKRVVLLDPSTGSAWSLLSFTTGLGTPQVQVTQKFVPVNRPGS
mgnify:FL=1